MSAAFSDDKTGPPRAAGFDDVDFDTRAAHLFLAGSRSPFIRAAASWLTDFSDPADVLIALSGAVSQTLGPWETFRLASLLGLFHSGAVQALGRDVLAEPIGRTAFPPPVAPAFALAHAKAHFPAADAPFVESARAALQAAVEAAAEPPPLLFSAQVALGVKDDATLAALLVIVSDDDGTTVAQPIWEAAVLSGRSPLAAAAAACAMRGQQPDGGLRAASAQASVRALTTLRALCLLRREDAGFV